MVVTCYELYHYVILHIGATSRTISANHHEKIALGSVARRPFKTLA